MILTQVFNDWGDIVTITPIVLPFIGALCYFLFYPLIERFVII
jgi:hypothetical protein